MANIQSRRLQSKFELQHRSKSTTLTAPSQPPSSSFPNRCALILCCVMALLRQSDIINLQSKTFDLHLSQSIVSRPLRQDVGIPIIKRIIFRPHGNTALLEQQKGDSNRHGSHLMKERLYFFHKVLAIRRRQRTKLTGYIERHMSSDGTIFPPRPDFIYRVGAEDPTKQHWTSRVPPRAGAAPEWYQGHMRTEREARVWNKESCSKWSAKLWWMRGVTRRMRAVGHAGVFPTFEQKREYWRVKRFLKQGS